MQSIQAVCRPRWHPQFPKHHHTLFPICCSDKLPHVLHLVESLQSVWYFHQNKLYNVCMCSSYECLGKMCWTYPVAGIPIHVDMSGTYFLWGVWRGIHILWSVSLKIFDPIEVKHACRKLNFGECNCPCCFWILQLKNAESCTWYHFKWGHINVLFLWWMVDYWWWLNIGDDMIVGFKESAKWTFGGEPEWAVVLHCTRVCMFAGCPSHRWQKLAMHVG